MSGSDDEKPARVFCPSRARRVVMSAMKNRRIRESDAVLMLALTTAPQAAWEDVELARVAGLSGADDVAERVTRLSARGWFTLAGMTGGGRHYTWRNEGPMRSAWVRPWERE